MNRSNFPFRRASGTVFVDFFALFWGVGYGFLEHPFNKTDKELSMRILMVILLLLVTGCSAGVYHVPRQAYKQQIKTLGVLPLLVDGHSVIKHPNAEQIIDLLRRASRGQVETVVDELRRKKGYFDVRILHEPARLLADKLLLKQNIDELGQPGGYQLNLPYLAELCKDAVVDGLLVLTLQGAEHNDKRWSRNTFETLITDYNDIMGTASVVSADGRVLWELSGNDATILLPLQYPDFDEAYYNKSDEVKLKFIGFPGLEKTLLPATGEDPSDQVSGQLAVWIKKVTSALSPTLFH